MENDLHLSAQVIYQIDEDVFFCVVIDVELAHRHAGLLRDFADGSAVESLPGKQLQGSSLDLELVLFERSIEQLRHLLPSDSQGHVECSRSKRALVLFGDFYSRQPGVVKKNFQCLASAFLLAFSLA